jgi:hypothetical protein
MSLIYARNGENFMVTMTEYIEAGGRAAKRRREEPHIIKAKYDAKLGRVILELSSGAWFAFRPEDAQGLGEATVTQLRKIEILPGDFAIDFPLLDVQFDIGALMHGRFGSKRWMAQRMGAAGSSVRSKAKTTAARANGKLGGRPRKSVAS